jgi:hypothetical protein
MDTVKNYIVDNCVISKIDNNGTRICKINFYKKYYGNPDTFKIITPLHI